MGLIIMSVVVVSYIYFSYREKKELNKYNDQILEDFKLEKPSILVFETSEGTKESIEIKPRIYQFFDKNKIQSSKERASNYLEMCYNSGYFVDNNEITYPTCEIKKVWIEEVENV